MGRWIERVPRRYDFCGCPPCPICYNYVSDIGSEVVDGVEQMIKDIIQDRVATPEERATLIKAADTIHERNKLVCEPITESMVKDAEDERWAGRRLEAMLRENSKVVERVEKKIDTRPTLDELTPEELAARSKPDKKPVPLTVKPKTMTEMDVRQEQARRELERSRQMADSAQQYMRYTSFEPTDYEYRDETYRNPLTGMYESRRVPVMSQQFYSNYPITTSRLDASAVSDTKALQALKQTATDADKRKQEKDAEEYEKKQSKSRDARDSKMKGISELVRNYLK